MLVNFELIIYEIVNGINAAHVTKTHIYIEIYCMLLNGLRNNFKHLTYSIKHLSTKKMKNTISTRLISIDFDEHGDLTLFGTQFCSSSRARKKDNTVRIVSGNIK